MKPTSKPTFRRALPLFALTLFSAGSAHAASLLADDFTATGTTDTNDINFNAVNRQTGTLAIQTWSKAGNVQAGNATAITNKPEGADYLLLAFGGKAQLGAMPLDQTTITGPVTVSFDAYVQNPDDTGWVSFTMSAGTTLGNGTSNTGDAYVAGATVPFGFLYRENGGIALFNKGTNFAGFASGAYTQDGYNWSFTFTDSAGIGSPYSGTTKVLVKNGSNTVGTWDLAIPFSTSTSHYLSFGSLAFGSQSSLGGIDNLVVSTGAANNDYATWAGSSGFNLTGGPGDDDDHDGLSNRDEHAFGLDPTSGSSTNPIAITLNPAGGTFTYQRRDNALTGLAYTIWTSTDLSTWTKDSTAGQVEGPLTGSNETVAVSLTGALLTEPKLFVQVRAQ